MLALSWHWYSSMVPEYLDNPAGRLLRVLRQLVAARDIRDEHRQNVFAKRRDAGVAPDAGFEEHEVDCAWRADARRDLLYCRRRLRTVSGRPATTGGATAGLPIRNSVRSLSDDEDPEFLLRHYDEIEVCAERLAKQATNSGSVEKAVEQGGRSPRRRCRVTRLSMAWRRVPVRFTAGNESRRPSSTRVSSTS